ncbi:phage tail tape measure protein [Providencia rettgeri]
MSNQIADLEIKIGANTTEFLEKAGRVERELNDQERKEQASIKRQQDFLAKQAAKAEAALARSRSQLKQFENESISAEQKLASERKRANAELDAAHKNIQGLIQAEARRAQSARSQEVLAEQYYAQLDAIKANGKGLEDLSAIKRKMNKDMQQGLLHVKDYQALGNSLKAITSLITPWKVAMFAGAGALTAFGVAAYQGSKELTEYNKQLILTGNYAAKTQGELNALAKSLSGDGITQYKMADTLAQVVGSGSFTGSQVDMVAGVAAKMEKATGQSIDETIKQFQRLKDQPVQAVMELDKSLHFLTATQLEQITTLEEQGRKTEATQLAWESFSTSMNARSEQIVENLGYLESAWNWVGNAAKSAWDKMLDIGREKSVEEQIEQIEDFLNVYKGPTSSTLYLESQGKLSLLRFQKMNQDVVGTLKKTFTETNELQKKQIAADLALKKQYESAEEKHQSKLEKIRNDEYASQAAKDLAIQREKERYQKEIDRKTPKGKAYKPDMGTRHDESAQAEVTSLQAQLRLLEQHSSATDFLSQQRKNLQLELAKFEVLEEARKTRKLSLDEQSLLKNKESILANKKQLADLGDKIAKQEHLNKLQDQADKYVKQQEARQKAIADSLGKSTIELQRALEMEQLRTVYGDTPQWDKVKSAKQATFDKEDAAKTDWISGASTAWGNYRDAALDANAQIQNVTSATLNGFSSQLVETLTGGEANFKDFTRSILKMLAEIAIKMTIVKGFEAFGFGSVTPNANGGVYNTPGLSAYSGQIVSKPTLFPFARGAGLMGEAGPEAILPLRRGIDGKLGVIAANTKQNSGDFYQTNHVTIQNDGSNGEIGPQALKAVYEVGKKGAEDYMRKQRRDGGSFS